MAEPTRFLLTLSSVSATTDVFKICYPGKGREKNERMKSFCISLLFYLEGPQPQKLQNDGVLVAES